jgi:hypothetical protein
VKSRDIGNPAEAWNQRIQKQRSPDDVFFEGDDTHYKRKLRHANEQPDDALRPAAWIADVSPTWTTRIGKGEIPPDAPAAARLASERNIVVTMWDMADGRFIHATRSRRTSVIRCSIAGGPVYGTAQFSGMVAALDPKNGKQEQFKLTTLEGDYAHNANKPHADDRFERPCLDVAGGSPGRQSCVLHRPMPISLQNISRAIRRSAGWPMSSTRSRRPTL